MKSSRVTQVALTLVVAVVGGLVIAQTTFSRDTTAVSPNRNSVDVGSLEALEARAARRESEWEKEQIEKAQLLEKGKLREFVLVAPTESDIDELRTLINTIQELTIVGHPISDKVLDVIVTSSHLTSLNLSNSNIDDRSLSKLVTLKKLKTLWLNQTAVGDDGLKHLRHLPELHDLGIATTLITDDGLKILSQYQQLTSVCLSSNHISDRAATHLAKLRKLRELSLDDIQELSNASVAAISTLPELWSLQMNRTQIDDGCIDDLLKIRELRFFSAVETKMNDDTLRRLQESLQKRRTVRTP